MVELNASHDPGLKSFVAAANVPASDFPIQNLPLGVFSAGGNGPVGGIAIGDQILDLRMAVGNGLFEGIAREAAAAAAGLGLAAALLGPRLKIHYGFSHKGIPTMDFPIRGFPLWIFP